MDSIPLSLTQSSIESGCGDIEQGTILLPPHKFLNKDPNGKYIFMICFQVGTDFYPTSFSTTRKAEIFSN